MMVAKGIGGRGEEALVASVSVPRLHPHKDKHFFSFSFINISYFLYFLYIHFNA